MTNDRWYFAYGSNLLIDQMVKRTGPIRQAIRCRLKGFRFAFNQQSDDGQIYANIVPDLISEVWGVVYLFDPKAFEKMDHFEGVGDGQYDRIPVSVENESGEILNAITYVAGENFVCEEGKPSQEYLDRIITGARQHGLPLDYINQIESLGR